ncbi:hypothetical protein GCM10010168_56440 [Actinoplanes ianthinogenes]|uniref:Uncharacterized protein n=1 Tax=Actinoplanes ianthinogenes TaxID=122358 RepID=A0ABM7M2S6_9ACTN|nr:hypothetical protein [Actinoplanes ianthinogenes]BCJ45936.1 hypothetical protein Aiant_65930 [Actinoplanes ianthinogenes]GGR31037.1 hypothetical protein GCM10010168_56440 [Actinoplanes ianthinogenes]
MTSYPVDDVARVGRRILIWRLAGLVLGLVAAILLATGPPSRLGVNTALAVPAFALGLLAGVILGEVTGRAPAGATRTATLEVRTATAFLPRRMTGLVAGLAVLAAAFYTATTLAAGPDDLGRAGRALTVTCDDVTVSNTPWPGEFYTFPIALAMLAGLTAAGFATWAVVRRRRPVADEAGRAADDAVRRTAARAIVAACGVLVCAPLAGSAAVAAGALGNIPCPSPVYPVTHWASLAIALVTGLLTCVFTAFTLRPGTR